MPSGRNLLVILPSGMRGDDVRVAGAWPIDTPNLDTLATAGLALTAVSPSPVDMSATVSLHTGLHPRQHGRWRGESPRRMPHGWVDQLRDAGYFLAGVGRVDHIADRLDVARPVAPLDTMRDESCEYLAHAREARVLGVVADQRKARRRAALFEPGRRLDDASQDVDGFIATAACATVERLPDDRPWAMVVAFTGPGSELPAPGDFLDLISYERLKDGFVPPSNGEIDRFAELAVARSLLQRLEPSGAAAIRREHLARVCLIDWAVGRLRDTIEQAGHARRTWWVLSSERGTPLGEAGLFCCRTLLGAGLYVPLWVVPPPSVRRAPNANDEVVRGEDGLVSGVDLSATICDLAGADPPPGAVGASVVPGLAGQEIGAGACLAECERRLMMETLQHKVIYDVPGGEPVAVYDLLHDGAQRNNLIETPQGRELAELLRGRLAEALLPLRPVATG